MSETSRDIADRIGKRYARLHQLMRDELQAQAWHEGWHAHFLEMDKQRLDPTHPITQTNPYSDKGVTA